MSSCRPLHPLCCFFLCILQVLFNFLSTQDNFARQGAVCRDALAFYLVRWSSVKPKQGEQEDDQETSKPAQESEFFWGAQLDHMLRQLVSVPSSCLNSSHGLSMQQVCVLCEWVSCVDC